VTGLQAMADYTLVPAQERADIDSYVQLFDRSFEGDAKLGRAYLDWQYVANPHGRVIGTDAFLEGELAAHYAVIPRQYRLGERVFSAALSVNTATHPDHQGKGLFVKLATETYARAAREGIAFIVGVANAQSIGGFIRRLGFIELGQVRLGMLASPTPARPSDLSLDIGGGWLDWRLANPARRYRQRRHSDDSVTIQTVVRSIPFNIARIPSAGLPRGLEAAPAFPGGMVPFYGPGEAPAIRLPLRLQPSPWHVIWKPLSPDLPPELPSLLRFDGLAMDTF
jgi:GNAT superfamily N-acetyltransferase